MPVPTPDHLALGASMSSSGFTDGLGRRAIGFDREAGTMLERLTVRPELAAFESLLRDRIDRLAVIEDERIARPGWIERDPDGGLVVVSEFVPGSRLSDFLDLAADQGTAPGLDAAFGYLLDVLPALCGLHAGAGFAHGTIAPSRTVLTPAGQVVLLDGIYGGALSLLRYTRRKLWHEFGLAIPAGDGPPRLEASTDIGQVVLAGVMLILGRPLYDDEFPGALPRVIADAVDVAQIRAGSQFALDFQQFLQRALPLPNRSPYATADDALIDLRTLAGQLGLEVCRRALVDFIEQMDPPENPAAAEPGPVDVVSEPKYDDVLANIATFGAMPSVEVVDIELLSEDEDDDSSDEAEIDLEELVEEPSTERSAFQEPDATDRWGTPSDWSDAPAGSTAPPAHSILSDPEPFPSAPAASPDDATQPGGNSGPFTSPLSPSVRSKRAKRTRSVRARKDKLRSAATPTPLATQTQDSERDHDLDRKHDRQRLAEVKEEPKNDREKDRDTSEHATRADIVERQVLKVAKETDAQQASERSQKTDTPQEPAARPAENWLVAPGRAEAFEPAVSQPPTAVQWPPKSIAPAAPAAMSPPPIPFTPMPAQPPGPPAISVASAAASAPVSPSLTVPTFGTAASWSPPAQGPTVTPVQPPAVQTPSLPQIAPVKLKLNTAPPRAARASSPAEDIYSTPAVAPVPESKSAFPWKFAAAALMGVALLIVAGKTYFGPAEIPAETEQSAPEPTPEPRSVPAPRRTTSTTTAASNAAATAASPATGRLEIETQPAGAQVLLDGKPVGESPLTLEAVAVGRHTVTLTSASGSVKRTIRIEAGRTMKVDVPIFSGWVGIFAPFVVVVSEGERVIGTTEESRLMLSPGRHVLTLTNRELGYRTTETVDIEPGEVRTISLDPRGTVNLNATPWAEVWVDGKKAGDTPLAGLQLPLGTQELTFRHPQYGERKTTVTVRGNQPVSLSVNMIK